MNTLPTVIDDAVEAYHRAALACADARDAEQQIEDERPMAKHAAIHRLMQGTNALTQKPHSASSAEAIVESDEEYAAYLVKRRNAVHHHMTAQAERETRRLRALAYANIASELVTS